jgi:predicted O-methyltransferase YrrM
VIDKRLNLDSGWSIGEASFEVIVAAVKSLRADAKIVEFGSGASSIRLACALPDSQIISVESDRHFFNQSATLAKEYGVATNLRLIFSPLKFHNYAFGKILSYSFKDCFNEGEIDCVIIDGPPFYTLRGREACLYHIYNQLKIGGIVVLNNYQRKGEKAILENWKAVYPDSFNATSIDVGKQLVLQRKQRSVAPEWDHPAKCRDAELINKYYDRIRLALLHLTDSEWVAGFNGMRLPRNRAQLYHYYIIQLRNAYELSSDEYDTAARIYRQFNKGALQRLRADHVRSCLDILGLL